METKLCYYCQKPIEENQAVKNFRSRKRDNCHLECWKENKRIIFIRFIGFIAGLFLGAGGDYPSSFPNKGGKKRVSGLQIRQTPDGVCPYCDQVIEEDQLAREFRMFEGKSSHLKCYQDRVHLSWWWWSIILILLLGLLSLPIIFLIIKI